MKDKMSQSIEVRLPFLQKIVQSALMKIIKKEKKS